METMIHPLTKEEFDDKKKYVEALAVSYEQVKKEMYQWGEDEKTLNDALDELGPDKIKKGKFMLSGIEREVEVGRKESSTYRKESGEISPLRKLMIKHDDLGAMLRLTYGESGAAIGGLIERYQTNSLRPNDNEELAKDLLEYRITKAAKPTIKIERKVKDVTETTEGAEAKVEF